MNTQHHAFDEAVAEAFPYIKPKDLRLGPKIGRRFRCPERIPSRFLESSAVEKFNQVVEEVFPADPKGA